MSCGQIRREEKDFTREPERAKYDVWHVYTIFLRPVWVGEKKQSCMEILWVNSLHWTHHFLSLFMNNTEARFRKGPSQKQIKQSCLWVSYCSAQRHSPCTSKGVLGLVGHTTCVLKDDWLLWDLYIQYYGVLCLAGSHAVMYTCVDYCWVSTVNVCGKWHYI